MIDYCKEAQENKYVKQMQPCNKEKKITGLIVGQGPRRLNGLSKAHFHIIPPTAAAPHKNLPP